MRHIPPDYALVDKARLAVELELRKKRRLNQPIACFDAKTREVFLEYSDGRREHVGYAARIRVPFREHCTCDFVNS